MSFSYNGWWASPDLPTRPLEVGGESFVPGVLDDDDVWTVLRYIAVQMHERVEPIIRSDWHDMDDWGFNYRPTTGDPNSLSCHSSGTAIDYNATRHPFDVPTSANFTETQIAEVRQIVNEAGVIRWGGEWDTADAMHFEIQGTKAEVAVAAARIRNGINQEDEMKDEDFARIRDIVKDELTSVEAKAQRANEQNTRILNKLENARQREVVANEQLRLLRDELDADSPVRRKLDRIINDLRAHDETP